MNIPHTSVDSDHNKGTDKEDVGEEYISSEKSIETMDETDNVGHKGNDDTPEGTKTGTSNIMTTTKKRATKTWK